MDGSSVLSGTYARSLLRSAKVLSCLIPMCLFGCTGNPFAEHDICFEVDCPGATDRFTTFTPVSCSESSTRLGDPMGADYARLKFRDADGDGAPEIVVESSAWRCSLAANCYDAHRIVAEVTPGRKPPVEVVSSEHLQGLAP